MTPEQRQNLELACQDLEANEHKARFEMRCGQGRCCLAVMADTACKIKGLPIGSMDEDQIHPKNELSEIFGLENAITNDQLIGFNFKLQGSFASIHNDSNEKIGITEKTHKEIAALIRKEYLS